MDIFLKRHIETLLDLGQVEVVFNLLHLLLPASYEDTLIIREGGYNRLLKQVSSGRLSKDDVYYHAELAKIMHVLRELAGICLC